MAKQVRMARARVEALDRLASAQELEKIGGTHRLPGTKRANEPAERPAYEARRAQHATTNLMRLTWRMLVVEQATHRLWELLLATLERDFPFTWRNQSIESYETKRINCETREMK